MPRVLTTNAQIMCPHGGLGNSLPMHRKWEVSGGTVLVEGDTGTLSCVNVVPCVGYTLKSMGLNATYVDGLRVILETDFNQSQIGLPLQIIETHSTYDESTPAGIPAGQPAPPPSPAMIDLVPPVVTVAPPQIIFSMSTQMPATAALTFTMSSANPLQWNLVLVDDALGYSQDVTNGLPPGLVVSPAGGDWSSQTQTVVVTMTAIFMNSLSGTSHFYLTAVSKRGLSGLAKADVQVS